MHPRPSPRLFISGILLLTPCLSASRGEAAELAQTGNPIGKVARIFNSQLVQVEDRVSWLDERMSTLAQHREHSMKVALGARGGRIKPGDPDPSVTLDLGDQYPLESLFLIPVQREFLEDTGIFPKRFTLEVSKTPDFSQRTVLFASQGNTYPSPEGRPVRFLANETDARYVRLTVHQGHNKGWTDIFGLSELAVISRGRPVSFGATVTSTGALSATGIWSPEALTDGCTPMGLWQNNVPSTQRGDSVILSEDTEPVSWTLTLDHATPIDHLVLYPYQLTSLMESSVVPESITVHLQNESGTEERQAYQWTNPLAGLNHMTPLVIPLKGEIARRIRITGDQPWQVGDLRVHALSEIEVWSKTDNLSAGKPVIRSQGNNEQTIASLTDGFATERQIIPFATWLNQLHERGRLESELAWLRPIRQRMASESELNATWGSAVMLGLTFLIPVFIVEKRRLQSRSQIDQLRKRIASDLHDDIGSNLGSISLIARTARKDLVRLHGPEEVAEDLGEVESIARESSLAMRDIVWLLEKRQDSIGDLIHRMRETAGRLLREINYSIECESTKTASKLSLDAKRHLFLFYKEAIHNILKHSKADQVSIRLWDEDDKLGLEILDNGIGLPEDTELRPVAVRKLQDRARVLDGNLLIKSAQGEGTRIWLTVKRSHLTAHPTLS